ncbi:kininogen-2-like isoform X2 [Mobula birostris]|uniref:kininogen-2-like isoform X2 n=1 Tax=Mobula birostris TaxID=1983395 RepID=UPI003B27C425
MKLFCIAFFTIQLLNIDAVSEPVPVEDHEAQNINCNDPGVSAAVDFTLRKLNAEQNAGNKFALYRVHFAQVQAQERFGLKYTVEFSIYETDCPVGSEKLWKDCDYNEPRIASSGKCNSETIINRIRRISDVISHNCTFSQDHEWIFPEKAPCLGCERLVEIDSPTVHEVSAYVTQEFNMNRTFTNYFRITKVHKLSEQVVAGMRYNMAFINQETECSKDHPLPYENVTACPLKTDGVRLQCTSTVLEQILRGRTASVTCQPEETLSFGGWSPFLLRKESVTDSTCPGDPWKSLHRVKPALPPDHYENDGSPESHESAEMPTDDAGLSASA